MIKIYLDNNATTQIDPKVFEAMRIDLQGPPANPSSVHFFGNRAKTLLIQARQTIASFFQVKPEEIIFTSGGTESINLFLRGLAKGHLITSNVEHSAIYHTVQELEKKGFTSSYVSVGLWGAPLAQEIEKAIGQETKAIVLGAANSETGVKIDIQAIAEVAHRYQIPLLIDAVAWIGKEPFPMYPGITAIALSGHKFHGPKGVGILLLRSSMKLISSITGGAQEHQRRAGTENLAGILGLAEAILILQQTQETITKHLLFLRNRLESGLKKEIPGIQIHGKGSRIANTASIAFPGIDGETLLIQLDLAGISASHGSACSSGAMEPSRVLTQMGISNKLARSSLRFSIGRFNTEEEIDWVIQKTIEIVKKMS